VGNPIVETDLFEALADLTRYVPIDMSRIYLLGYSLGGTTALLLAEHHPGFFAAVAAITPPIDFGSTRSADFQQKLAYLKGPAAIAGSLKHTPLYILQAERDKEVSPEEIRRFVRLCAERGVPVESKVGRLMQHSVYSFRPEPDVLRFFKGKRAVTNPKEVRLETWNLKYNSAFWLDVTAMNKPLQVASVRAQCSALGSVRITSENVRSLQLNLGKMQADPTAPITVEWNGSRKFQGRPSGNVIALSLSAKSVPSAVVNPGPLVMAFSEPFAVVRDAALASASAPPTTAFEDRWRERFYVDCRSTPESKSLNLVFYRVGSSVSIPSHIPLRVIPDAIEIGTRRYAGSNLSYAAVYPNATNPERAVVVMGSNSVSGVYCGEDEPFLRGWFDAAIWQCGANGRAELLDLGYWDSSLTKLYSYSELSRW
jgi:fermentation-respiration switch protein FrsA (DUF1100 family)